MWEINVGIETNPTTGEIYNRPPSLDKYIESTKIHISDIKDNGHIDGIFWCRKSNIYNNIDSDICENPSQYYITDFRIFDFGFNRSSIYNKEVACKYFDHLKRLYGGTGFDRVRGPISK